MVIAPLLVVKLNCAQPDQGSTSKAAKTTNICFFKFTLLTELTLPIWFLAHDPRGPFWLVSTCSTGLQGVFSSLPTVFLWQRGRFVASYALPQAFPCHLKTPLPWFPVFPCDC